MKSMINSIISIFMLSRFIFCTPAESISECNCSCASNKTKLFVSVEDLHITNKVVSDLKQKKLSLITGIPYFLLNSLSVNYGKSFYGTSSPADYWTNNTEVGHRHMQWDIIPTEYFGYYQLRRARDARVITCWKNRALVTLTDGRLNPEYTFLSIEESPKRKAMYILRCKLSPKFAVKIDLSNEEFGEGIMDENFLWQFQPAYTYTDYFVQFSITNFEYATPPNNLLSDRQKQVGIISEETIDNPSAGTIESRFSRSSKKIQRYKLVINKSYKKGESSAQFGSSTIRSSSTESSSITMADTTSRTKASSTSNTASSYSQSGTSERKTSSSSNTHSTSDSETNFKSNSERTQSDHTFTANLNAGISAKMKLLGRGVGAKADLSLGYKYYHSNIQEKQDSTTQYHQTSDTSSTSSFHDANSFSGGGSSHSKTDTSSSSQTNESMRSQTTGRISSIGNDNTRGATNGTVTEKGEDKGVIWEKSEEITYTVERTIRVPPNSGVTMSAYVDWFEDLELPYKAEVFVTVQGMKSLRRFTNCGRINEDGFDIKICQANAQKGFLDADGVEWFLRQFDNSLVRDQQFVKSDMAVVLQTSGKFTGSYGITAVYSARNIKPSNSSENCNNEE